MIRSIVLLGLLCVAACGDIHPATSIEFGPSPGGNYNPISGTRSNGSG